MNMKKVTEEGRTPEDIAAKLGVEVESHTSLGITPEFVWYEADILTRDMQAWQSRFKRMVEVVESQRKSSDRMLQQVMDENRELKVQLSKHVNRASN